MKQLLILYFALLPLICFSQVWTIDAGDDFVFCDGDVNIQLQGAISNPDNDSLSVLWETSFSIGSNTYYAEDFLDNVNFLTPTLTSNISSASELTFYLKVSDNLGNQQLDSVTVVVSSFYGHLGDYFFHIEQGDSAKLQISAGGGLPPYTYEWLPNTNILDNTVRNPIVYPTTSTDYSVTMIDSRGCVIPSNVCDVNEVYVEPLNITEIENSGIKWYFEHDQLIIETEKFVDKRIVLYNSCGKLMNTYLKTDEVLNISMSNLEKGMYFLSIDNKTLKFVW